MELSTTREIICSDWTRLISFITRSSRSARSAARELPPPLPSPLAISAPISKMDVRTTKPSRRSMAFVT